MLSKIIAILLIILLIVAGVSVGHDIAKKQKSVDDHFSKMSHDPAILTVAVDPKTHCLVQWAKYNPQYDDKTGKCTIKIGKDRVPVYIGSPTE